MAAWCGRRAGSGSLVLLLLGAGSARVLPGPGFPLGVRLGARGGGALGGGGGRSSKGEWKAAQAQTHMLEMGSVQAGAVSHCFHIGSSYAPPTHTHTHTPTPNDIISFKVCLDEGVCSGGGGGGGGVGGLGGP